MKSIPPRERGRYQGYLAGIAVSSNTFGPVAGGYLTQAFGWQSIFWINIPLGLLATLFVFRIPPRQGDRRRTTFDSPGLVLFIFFVGPVILALEQVQRMQLSAMPMALAMLAVGLVSLGLLTWQERLTPAPLIPPKLFRQPSIWRADAMAALHGAALVSLITFLPIYLRAVRGASPGETGLILLPLTAGIGIGSMLTGQMVTRTGYTAVFPTCGLIGATVGLLFIAFWIPHLSTAEMAWAFCTIALFMGTVMGVVQVTVQAVSGPRLLGTGAAMVQFSRSVGAAFGTAAVAAILFSILTATDRTTATSVRHHHRARAGGDRGARSSAAGDGACPDWRRLPRRLPHHCGFYRMRRRAGLVAAAAPSLTVRGRGIAARRPKRQTSEGASKPREAASLERFGWK